MPIITQQYLTVVYIICTGLRNRGGNAPPNCEVGGGKCPPCPPSSAAYVPSWVRPVSQEILLLGNFVAATEFPRKYCSA